MPTIIPIQTPILILTRTITAILITSIIVLEIGNL